MASTVYIWTVIGASALGILFILPGMLSDWPPIAATKASRMVSFMISLAWVVSGVWILTS